MSLVRLIIASLWYHRRSNVAVALGVAVGTAVLTGALLVGDSMRGSLRHLVLDRFGRIDEVLLAPRFFRAQLAAELAEDPGFHDGFQEAQPAILVQGSLESANVERPSRANRVTVIGCAPGFWQLGHGGPPHEPGSRQIVLNRPLAEQLGAKAGDAVLVHLPSLSAIPADSALGRKRETVQTQRLTVAAIIEAEGLGRFAVRSNQQTPRNAYVPLAWLQDRLGQPDRANMILVAGHTTDRQPVARLPQVLRKPWQPKLIDYGIRLRRAKQGYLDLTSDQMLLDPAAESRWMSAFGQRPVQPVLTYLANTIACGNREIPYSTVAAMDMTDVEPLGPMRTPDGKPIGKLADNEIVLNGWAADSLKAKPGDVIRLDFFEPESTHGQSRTRTAEFKLAAVAAMAGPAADPALTPEVPGITDQKSIADWDPPFPFDGSRIRPEDDRYWADHKATPKAFVSLAAGRKLWSSRFGRTTSLRFVDTERLPAEEWEKRLALPADAMGFVFQPVKADGLAAAQGTTPFGVLFLAFSFFTIIAAVLLVALLFRLGIETRSSQIGTLLAVGYPPQTVVRMLAIEGSLVAMTGSLVGLPVGVGYAALMLWGLKTWWVAAIVTPFLNLYVGPLSLLIGWLCGTLIAMAVIRLSVRRIKRLSCRQLLAGSVSDESAGRAASRRGGAWLQAGLAVLMVAAIASALLAPVSEAARALVFFGAGSTVLASATVIAWLRFRCGATGAAIGVGRGNLVRLALRNAARHPGRSSLTIVLVASATFLVASMSAFRLDPSHATPQKQDGTGGFALVAESDQPLYHDFNTDEGRQALGFAPQDAQLLAGTNVIALRVKPGDDASCRNLYQARRPRLLGVPDRLVEHGGFAWEASAAVSEEDRANPWRLLRRPTSVPGRVPVIIEKNTAVYALHLSGQPGDVYPLTDSQGKRIELEVVALLSNSIFQGDLLIDERKLLELFPEVSGYQVFLVSTDPSKSDTSAVRGALERTLADYGLVAQTTGERLAGFLAVQNTYLATFQSLGGLGLLLGTFGLAVVQMRNIVERRRELALLRAAGFTRRSLGWLVLIETGVLLAGGLAFGLAAAGVAVLPQLISGGAGVPWAALGGVLLAVVAVGAGSSLLAVRAMLAAPLIPALRGE